MGNKDVPGRNHLRPRRSNFKAEGYDICFPHEGDEDINTPRPGTPLQPTPDVPKPLESELRLAKISKNLKPSHVGYLFATLRDSFGADHFKWEETLDHITDLIGDSEADPEPDRATQSPQTDPAEEPALFRAPSWVIKYARSNFSSSPRKWARKDNADSIAGPSHSG
ncbi:hypothetical protein CF326_g6781 [Tilletia indica]|nr:hypothetical protein CF326_g6781 [Tilletia indica]